MNTHIHVHIHSFYVKAHAHIVFTYLYHVYRAATKGNIIRHIRHHADTHAVYMYIYVYIQGGYISTGSSLYDIAICMLSCVYLHGIYYLRPPNRDEAQPVAHPWPQAPASLGEHLAARLAMWNSSTASKLEGLAGV